MNEKSTSSTNQKVTPVVMMPTKSMIGAILLTLFFGPLGLFYSSVMGGFIMLVLSAIVGLLTAGFGLIVTQIICVIWGVISVNSYNKKLVASVTSEG